MKKKKSNKDSSNNTFTVGSGKVKPNSKRAGTDKAPEFQLNTGWPKKKYKKDSARVRTTNPSHEGEEWFDSKSFNDSETNKRPLHPEKDYLNKQDGHTGDDYIEMGHDDLEDKVKYSENPNLDQENYNKGGYKKIKGDGWTGNDHLKVKLEKPKKGTPIIVGYTPPSKTSNLDKKPDIYKVNENIKNMKAINEQTNRIKQMMRFEDGMSYEDVKKLTEGHEDPGFAAVEAPAGTVAVSLGNERGANTLKSTWAHNLGTGLDTDASDVYGHVTDSRGRTVAGRGDGGKYDVGQLGQRGTVTKLYRGVPAGRSISYSTPLAGEYGGTLGSDGKVFTINSSGKLDGVVGAQPWFWGTHARGASDKRGVQYDQSDSSAAYTRATKSADDARPWARRDLTPVAARNKGTDLTRGASYGVTNPDDYSTEDAYDRAIKTAVATPQQSPKAGKSRRGGTGSGSAGGFEAPVMNPATGKVGKTKKMGKNKVVSETPKRKRTIKNNNMSFWGGKAPIYRLMEQDIMDKLKQILGDKEGLKVIAIKKIQEWCKVPVDGKVGPKTSECLKKFQTENDLTADGKLNQQTLKGIIEGGILGSWDKFVKGWSGSVVSERYRPRTKKVRLTESQLIQVIEKTVGDHLQERTTVGGLSDQTIGSGFKTPQGGSDRLNTFNTRQQEMGEGAKWIQKANKEIEKDGTEGEFHDWCVSEGFKDGCSKGCIDKGLKGTEKRRKQAQFAKNTCK